MYFSEAHPAAAAADGGDWFDPLMEVDTQLFVDPFLIFKDDDPFWSAANDSVVDYFQRAFELLAGHHDNPSSLQYRKTVELMRFPEPQEFGLGFVATGTRGSGTGLGFARRIVSAMVLAIEAGLGDLHHFEELGLLVKRIGRDRISDMTCNLLKPTFIQYTQSVCEDLGIEVEAHEVEHGEYDDQRRRWTSATFDLPTNPITGGAVLLTPKRFLRELPSLNADDWWNYVEPELRDDLNLEIGQKLKKADIIALAQRHPDLVRRWSEAREDAAADPYNVDRDPEGLHQWQALTRDVAGALPLGLASVAQTDLSEFIEQVNRKFKLFVEEQGGWRLLWNEDSKTPRRETSVQLLYKGVVQSYCQAYGVAIDREVELGRGPVDFIFSTSPANRVLMEVKKINNGDFWNGLEAQLISYMTSDECSRGWFLAIRFGDTKTQRDRSRALGERTRAAAVETGFALRSAIVDARWKQSASNLKPGKDDTSPTPGQDDEFEDPDE